MKKTRLKRAGKKTKQWHDYRKELKSTYQEKGITSCELKFDVCFGNNYLGFAHRHKRSWYYKCPELLKDFNETILACHPCHQEMEHDKELSEEMFNKLRK